MSEKVRNECNAKMKATMDHLTKELASLHSGRPTPALVDSIKVNYYGTPTPMKQLASINVAEGSTIVIKPWDQNSLKDIEKAISTSELGLPPNNDGKVIRVNVPPLTEERRKSLAEEVSKMAEQAKISLRNSRREANKEIDKEEKANALTEDDSREDKEKIQKMIKDYENKIDEVSEKKQQEITSL